MDAVLQLVLGKEPVGIAETMPGRLDGEQTMPGAQILCDHVEQGDIPAVRIEQHELAHAGAGDAGADLAQDRDQARRRKAQRAGVILVLGRDADCLNWQEQHRQVLRQPLNDARDIALHQQKIDAERQMRPMLLDGGDRHDGDRILDLGRLKIAPGQFRPKSRRQHCLPGSLYWFDLH